ncbi:unnamed protein product, partial [Polarella glacialis]
MARYMVRDMVGRLAVVPPNDTHFTRGQFLMPVVLNCSLMHAAAHNSGSQQNAKSRNRLFENTVTEVPATTRTYPQKAEAFGEAFSRSHGAAQSMFMTITLTLAETLRTNRF